MMLLQPPAPGTPVDPFAVVVAGPDGPPDLREAIEAAGGELAGRCALGEAAVALHRADHPVLVIETRGLATDALAADLPPIEAVAAALDVPVVVLLDQDAIDVVAAAMLETPAQLLCAPTAADLVVALALAGQRRGSMIAADTLREGEAARLQRLNDEVARIAEVLSRLTRRGPDERGGAIVSEHPSPFRPPDRPSEVVIDAAEVRRVIRARRMRDQHFGGGLFEDPAWDCLLDLFAAELDRTQVSVSSLCIAAAVAPTTALRWIAKLTEAGLLERHPDPFDRRRAFMELSPRASRAMHDHVGALRRAGLPFG